MALAEPWHPRGHAARGWWLLRRLLAIGLLLALAALAAAVVYIVTLPGVGDAPARTRALMAVHHERPAMPVPTRLAQAVIATEDSHFDDNVVVNVATGAGRAALSAVDGNGNPGGATIDQQLAKRLYGPGGGLGGTLRQIGLGIKLGLHFSHHELLAMYLNANYYGHGFWGVRQASEGYFGTEPGQLRWSEASMLAGLLQAPSAYDPLVHHALAKQRQAEVLARLVAEGRLTQARADAAYRAPLPLR